MYRYIHSRWAVFGKLLAAGILLWLTYVVLETRELRLLDNVDLIFHEAGHAILFWTPEFLMILGGTLMQLAVPLVCAVYFFRRKEMVSASVTFWWFGQSLVNVSVYIADAQARILPLLGNGGHDWTFLLSSMNVIQYDTRIGTVVLVLGAIVMFLAVAEIVLLAGKPFIEHKRDTTVT